MSKQPRHPSTQPSSGFGFKTRFSLSSLLPARHPPLVISHPAPALPTRTVQHTRPVLRVSDRIESSYGLTDDPFDVDQYAPPCKGYSKKRQSGISVNGGRLAIPPKCITPKKRPPPLNLARTKAAFPTIKGVTLVRDPTSPSPTSTSSPSPPSSHGEIKVNPIPKRNESLPVVRGTGDMKEAASKAGWMFKGSSGKKEPPRPRLAIDSPCDDFVTIEPQHKYPSWKGGKVDIRPGEHIPPDLIRTTSKQQEGHRKPPGAYLAKPDLSRQASSVYSPDGDQYESVLHNVLLIPTYNAPSTAHKSTTDLKGRSVKRQTFMGRASGWGKSVLKTVPAVGATVIQYGKSVRAGATRPEEKEMTRFPPLRVQRSGSHAAGPGADATAPRTRERTISASSSSSTPRSAIRGVQGTPYRRSPAWSSGRDREESVGFEKDHTRDDRDPRGGGGKRPIVGVNVSWQAGDGKRGISVSEAWRVKKEKEQALKRKKLLWRCGLGLVFVILAAIAIGICVSQLTKRDSDSAPSTPKSGSDSSVIPSIDETPSVSTPSLPAPTATDAPRNLRTCIEQYDQAPSNPTAYPCSECVPLLASTVNDFETELVGGNSTNVGAALQFCALMDIYRSAPGLQGQGWAGNGGVCGWKGVACDQRGRVSQIILEYPNVPSALSDTLGDIVSLSSLKVLGNHKVPSGEIPARLFQLQSLAELDLEFTAITGPLPSNLDGLPRLRSLTLVNNQQLGANVPNLSGNRALQTMVITGQGLKDTDFDTLPSSLTYLDLSFNNFEGPVPSLIQLTSLQTLYMTNNNFASPPNSLPTSLQTLSLTSNAALKGSMPSTLCSNSNLRACDLRNTDLGGATGVTTVASSNATSSTSMISAVGGGAGRTCGPCRFT